MSIENPYGLNPGWKVDPDGRYDRTPGPVIPSRMTEEDIRKYGLIEKPPARSVIPYIKSEEVKQIREREKNMVHKLNISTEDLLRICKVHGTGQAGRAAIAEELGMSVHTAKRYITERGIVKLLKAESITISNNQELAYAEEQELKEPIIINSPRYSPIETEEPGIIADTINKADIRAIDAASKISYDVDEMMEMVPDMINKPPHYTMGKLETIDIIQDKLTPEEFEGFCKGVIIQYVIRSKTKGGVESLEKAEWYPRKLIKVKKCG